MATDVGNLNGVVKSTESQYEEMMTTGQSYSDTKIYLIDSVPDKVLWTNPNPTSSMQTQFINIVDCSDYRYLIIERAIRNDALSVGNGYQKFVNPFYKGADYDMKNRKWFYLSGISENGYTYSRHLKMMTPTVILVQYGCISNPQGSPQYEELLYACTPLSIIGTNSL